LFILSKWRDADLVPTDRPLTMHVSRGDRLDWIELGRGLAAFAVVLSHVDMWRLPDGLRAIHDLGRWGVAFFFVLSGFIIFHVHAQDIGTPRRAPHFAWRRFLRLFPLYWGVFLLLLLLRTRLGDASYAPHIDSSYILQQALLLPGGLLVNTAWTLRHELLFYGIFLVAILNRTVGALLFLVWLSIIVASIPLNGLVEEWPRPASNFITSHLNLYFFFGMAIAAAHRKKCNSSLLISLVVATAFVSLLRLLWPSDYTMAAVQVLASTLAVSLAVWQHDANVPAPPGSRLLGEISYPIYLIHPTCYLVARGVVKRLGAFLPVPLTIEFLLAIIMSIGAAIFLARLLRRLYRIASIRSISLKLDN